MRLALVVPILAALLTSIGAAVQGQSEQPLDSMAPSVEHAAGATASSPVPPHRIAFDRNSGDGGAEGSHLGVFSANADGSDERRIPVEAGIVGWSPDGSQLLLTVFGAPAISDPDGSAFRVVEIDTDMLVWCSDWSPDGTTLLCAAEQDGHPEVDGIYTVKTDGTDLTRLTTSPYHFTQGTSGQCGGGQNRGVYSPDGSQIAFIEQRCGTGPRPDADESAAIELMNSDGSGLTEIVPQGKVQSHPGSQLSWSPDGSLIAFNSQDGHIYVVRPDGADLEELPIEGGWGGRFAMGPDWSPDGSRLAFAMYTDVDATQELHTVAPDGSGLTKVTETPGAENFVRWQVSSRP
jgi:Tol biopolymer transport system component